MPSTITRPTADPAGPAPAAERTVRLLEVLANHRGPLGVTAAATALGLPKSSTAYLLDSLERTGMVRRRGTGWLLGFRVLELGRSLVASSAEVAAFRRGVARSPVLRAETCLLAVLDGSDVVYLDRHDGEQPVRFINEVGARASAAVTALGRAALAGLPDAEVRARFAGTELPRPTARSLPDLPALLADLAAVRTRGHALDTGQGVAGVGCVAVAVPGDEPHLAVSVSMARRRLERSAERRLAAGLTELAGRVADESD